MFMEGLRGTIFRSLSLRSVHTGRRSLEYHPHKKAKSRQTTRALSTPSKMGLWGRAVKRMEQTWWRGGWGGRGQEGGRGGWGVGRR